MNAYAITVFNGDLFFAGLLYGCVGPQFMRERPLFGEFVFKQPDGEKFPCSLLQQVVEAEDTGDMPIIQRQIEKRGLADDPGTTVRLWEGEDFDDDLAVEAMMAMEPNEIRNPHHVPR